MPTTPRKKPPSLKKRSLRLAAGIALAAGAGYLTLVWWCASEIAEPSRRLMSAAQSANLSGSAEAGFTVGKFVSEEGMPYLVCTPAASPMLSEKAALIRSQVTDMGVSLASAGHTVGTLVILHGRSGMKEDYLPVAERYCAIGFRCLIPDLPGHGANPARFATYGVNEGGMVLRCLREAGENAGFAHEPCVVLGQSMGGSVAVHAAALPDSPFRAMVVVASFDRLETVIRSQTEDLFGTAFGAAVRKPADLVVGWRTGVRITAINPVEKAASVAAPVMIVHGDADNSVPTRAGKELFAAFREGNGKRWLSVPGADHNNVLVTDYPLYAEMGAWLLGHVTSGG